MNILRKFDQCIDRMDDEELSLQEYINSNSVKSVTDKEVKSGVDRLIYNHAVNKTQVVKFCGTSMPTFNIIEKQLLAEGRVNEPFLQGQANMYNRFDLAVFMEEFKVPTYRQRYEPAVIGVINHKGGIGKSTTVRTLAMALALDTILNARIVILDLDPQGSAGLQGQPKPEDSVFLTISDICLRNVQKDSPFYRYVEEFGLSEVDVVLSAAVPTHLPNLQLYSAFPDDEQFTDYYHTLSDEDKIGLLRQLADYVVPILKQKYDIILLDTPPQDSPITWSAMLATDFMLTPIAPKALDYLSTRNFVRFTRDRIEQIGADQNIKEWKLVPVMVDYTDRTHELNLDRIRRLYTDRLTSNVIELSELFYAADHLQRSIYDIQKAECKERKYTSINQYELAITSSNAVYRELRGLIQNIATKAKG